MNKRITNIEERNNILEKYPIENILSLLKDTLDENILVRDIATINNNIMLEVTNLDNTNDYFIKMTPYEEQEFINRIDIIVANPDKTYFIKYVYNYTSDNFVICKVVEKIERKIQELQRELTEDEKNDIIVQCCKKEFLL